MQLQLFGTLLVCMLLIGVFINSYVYKHSTSNWLAYILFAFIGARIAYVLLTYESFLDTLVRFIYWKQGGFNFWGAAFAFIVAFFLINKRDTLKNARNYTAPLSLLLFFVSWAFISIPNGYGTETTSVFGIHPYSFVILLSEEYSNLIFHPLFLYSAVYWFISFIILSILKHGSLLLWYVTIPTFRIIMLYFMDRLSFFEFFMTGLWLLFGFFIYFYKTRFKYFN